ncbi:MAG: glutathione peroxidase [Bacteroidia bacterium]|nr:glutathione peroxidase [Bacteroidia bacterium]
MKNLIIKLFMTPFFFLSSFLKGQPSSSILQFTATSIEGKQIDFKEFKGKKIIIVNTASECGLTPQFKELQTLYTTYKDSGLMIIGFPTNDFAHQDPGTNNEIHSFCERNYGVTFLMMQKISVKGADTHPVYKWLTQKSQNGVMNSTVKWNFQKYLIDENGFLVSVVSPWKKPDCKKIIKWLNKKQS